MKSLYKIVIIVFVTMTVAFSQEIEVSKEDRFTGEQIMGTGYEKMCLNANIQMYFSVLKHGEYTYMKVRVMIRGSVFSVNERDKLSFKTDTGKIINLYAPQYNVTSFGDGSVGFIGCSAMGMEIRYNVSEDVLTALMDEIIVLGRFTTSDGYIDFDLKPKAAEKIKKAFILIR